MLVIPIEWPLQVPIIDPIDLSIHKSWYSDYHTSLPGMWGIFRKTFPRHHEIALQVMSKVCYVFPRHKDIMTYTRMSFLHNIVCSVIGYTEGQSQSILNSLDHFWKEIRCRK